MKRVSRSAIIVSVLLLFALLLSGCYWTPDGDEGAITLKIESSSIGTSAIEDYKFLLGYVIAGDLLSGDRAAADRAFDELGAAFEKAISETFADPNLTEQDLDEFELSLTFPTIQLQADYFVGTSGTNTFGGLRAGREYFVVILAQDFQITSETYLGDIGFTAVTVEGGETKTVNLELGNNWVAFNNFLDNRYGYLTERAAIEIVMPNTYPDPSLDPPFYQGLDPMYVDLLAGDSVDPPNQFLNAGPTQTWYEGLTVLTPSGRSVDKTKDRPIIPAGTAVFRIEGVMPNRAWRLLLAEWSSRTQAGTNSDYVVSTPFTTSEGITTVIDFSTPTSSTDFPVIYFSS
jgi:hypothetical protein